MPLLLTCVVLAAVAAPVGADDAWKAYLEKPLSPGSVAILIEQGREPEVVARWRTALADRDSAVRAAAARAIYAANSTELLPDVMAALPGEVDDSVAAEELRALAAMSRSLDDALFVETLKRHPRDAGLVGSLLGHRRGVEALALLPRLRDLDPTGALRENVVDEIGKGPESLAALASAAARDDDSHLWRAAWQRARDAKTALAADVVTQSVQSPNPRVRALTYWYLALEQTRDEEGDEHKSAPLPEVVVKALASAPEGGASEGGRDAEEEARFAFEMLRRARGEKARDRTDWLRSRDADGSRSAFPGPLTPLAEHLTKGERGVLTEAHYLPRNVEKRRRTGVHVLAPVAAARLRLLSVHSDFPPRYVQDLTEVTGCHPKERVVAEADITFNGVGLPRTVQAQTSALPDACLPVVRAMLASVVVPPVPGTKDRVRFRFDQEDMDCAASIAAQGLPVTDQAGGVMGAPPGPDGAVRVGGNIKEPKRLKNVQPVYPAVARQERVTGVVILEAAISPCGRVADLKLLRGVHSLLDEAALQAVSQWSYTPTLLNGVPVPVIMTVTVNFTLQ